MSAVICVRKSDGVTFEPSKKEGYSDADALADLLASRRTYFFRRVEYVELRPWFGKKRNVWRRTGETWEPKSGEFYVTSTDVEFEGER